MKEKTLMEHLCSHHGPIATNKMLRDLTTGIVGYAEKHSVDNESLRNTLKELFEPLRISEQALNLDRVVLDNDKKAVIATISKEMLREGLGDMDSHGKLLNTGTIRFVTDQMAEGTVAKIGEYWFYFSDHIAASSTPDQYILNTKVETIVEELYCALEDLASEVNIDEYMYYYYTLLEASGNTPVYPESQNLTDKPAEADNDTAMAGKLSVKTPKGIMYAETKGTYGEYPGFFISMEEGYCDSDPLMATVEYDTANKRLQIAGYMKGSDALNTLNDFDTGESLL